MKKPYLTVLFVSLLFFGAAVPAYATDKTIDTPTVSITVSTNPVYQAGVIPEIGIKESATLGQSFQGLMSRIRGQKINHTLQITNPVGKVKTEEITSDTNAVSLDPSTLRPGTFHLAVDNKPVSEFSWGVLVIDTDKDVYKPGESAYVQMAALDAKGHTVCGAPLTLSVGGPDGTFKNFKTADNSISLSPTCGKDNVTDSPDYFVNYPLPSEGKYTLSLTNTLTGNTIYSTVSVTGNSAFTIGRTGASRINPYKANYTMRFKVTSEQVFEGDVSESLPKGFKIIDPAGVAIPNSDGSQTLIWHTSFTAGQEEEFSYIYQGAPISPQIYSLGPVVISQSGTPIYTENRTWQIASDSTITFVGQSPNTNSGAGTSGALGINYTSTTGNTLIVFIDEGAGGSATVPTVDDNAGGGTNTWVVTGALTNQNPPANFVAGQNSFFTMAYSLNAFAVTTVTVHLSTAKRVGGIVTEWSGIATSSAVDQSASTNATSTTLTTPTITTTNANDLIIGGLNATASTSNTLTSGSVTAGYQSTNDFGLSGTYFGSGAYLITSTTLTNTSISWTPSSSQPAGIGIMAFKAAATNSAPNTPTLDAPLDGATGQSVKPSFSTTATDPDSDYLRYKIKMCTDSGLTANCQTFDETSSQTGWTGQDTQSATAYTSGTQATYIVQSALNNNTTYYWDSQAIDPGGSNTFGSTQGSPHSFTTAAAVSGNSQFQGIQMQGINLQ